MRLLLEAQKGRALSRAAILVHLGFLAIFILQPLIGPMFGGTYTEILIRCLEVELVGLFVFDLAVVAKEIGGTSTFMFYNIAFGMFLLTHVIADLVGFMPIADVVTMITMHLPRWAVLKTLEMLLLVVIIQVPLYFLFVNIIHVHPRKRIQREATGQTAKIVFLLFLPLAMYRSIVEMRAIAQIGYAALYRGALAEVLSLPFVVRISTTIVIAAFMIFLNSRPPRREFLFFGSAFLAVQMADMLKGYRGMFAVTIVFLIWCHNKMYERKFRFWHFLPLAPILLIVLVGVGVFRSGDLMEAGSVWDAVGTFLYGVGSSILVPGLCIAYGDIFVNTSYPYILDPLVYLFNVIRHPEILQMGQSVELLAIRNDLAHQLTYFSNPGFYLNGQGIGNCYVAELLEFGVIGIVVGVVALVAFIVYFEKATDPRSHSTFFVLFSYTFFYQIVYSPRNNFFPNTYLFLRDSIVILAILALSSVLRVTVLRHVARAKRGWTPRVT